MPSLANRIRRARTSAKLTQDQLAGSLGVHRSAVAQWEQPRGTRPTTGNLMEVAKATGVGFDWLALGRGNARPRGAETVAAAFGEDFAHDHLESRLLVAFRRVRPRNREPLVIYVETLT